MMATNQEVQPNKKSDVLGEHNFRAFADEAIERYQQKGKTREAVFWEDVVAQYKDALGLGSKKPRALDPACTAGVERRMMEYQINGFIVDLLFWGAIIGHYNAALDKALDTLRTK